MWQAVRWSAKLGGVRDELSWMGDNSPRKTLVFCVYIQDAEMIMQLYARSDWSARLYSGGMSYDKHAKAKLKWETDKKVYLFRKLLKARGVRLNSLLLCVSCWLICRGMPRQNIKHPVAHIACHNSSKLKCAGLSSSTVTTTEPCTCSTPSL